MAKNQEERFDSIERGQVARLVHSEVIERIAERESAVVSALVSHYRANKLTNEMMLGAVAEISALRMLLGALEREIQQGIQATEKEFSRPGL